MKNGNDNRTMIERVAETIWNANRPPGAPLYENLDTEDHYTVEDIARKCIEAMREPSNEMIRFNPGRYNDEELFTLIENYKSMIDAALEEN